MSARPIGLAFLSVLCIVCACGGSPPPAEPTKPVEEKPERGRVVAEDDVSEKGKSWGGWRWKGKRDDCFFVFDNQCFDDKAAACEAAGCGETACRVKRGAPSKVSCKK